MALHALQRFATETSFSLYVNGSDRPSTTMAVDASTAWRLTIGEVYDQLIRNNALDDTLARRIEAFRQVAAQ